MDANGDREIDWEVARLSGGLSAARRVTPAHQGSLRPCDWNLEEPEEGPLSRRGDVLARDLADYEASSRRPILESLAPISMESVAFAAPPPPAPVSAPRKRHNRSSNAFWAGAAGAMSVIALGLVARIGMAPVPSASAALPATPRVSQTTAPATQAMATEGVPFTARPMVMLEPVEISGKTTAEEARAEARTAAAPARPAALAPTAAMAASLAAASPRVESAKAPSVADLGSAEFSRSNAAVAISAAGRRAAACLQPGDARGSMPVSVTFAPSGRVTSSTVDGGAFAGTTTGGCIARALRSAGVAPFDGAPVTVHSSVSIR